MRKKKGNLKLFPLLIVVLFIMISVGFIFNEKSNNASREEVIENEDKAVNKTDESTESSTVKLEAFENISIVHQGDVSKEKEDEAKKECQSQLTDLNITVTYTKDKDDNSKVKKATIECKPKKGTVKKISNEDTLKVEIGGDNFDSKTITCKNDGSAQKVEMTPKKADKEASVQLKINFYVPATKEDGKVYCSNAVWQTKYGEIEIGKSDSGYSLTEPHVRKVTSTIKIEPISETSRDNPDEHVDGYKVTEGLYPEAKAQTNTTISKQSQTENTDEKVRRDSTTTNYDVNVGDDLTSISYSYNEYDKAFKEKANNCGDNCFGEEGTLKKFNDHAYSYKFPLKEVRSASDIKPDKISGSKIELYCNEALTAEKINLIEEYNRQTAKKYYESDHTGHLTEYYYDEANTTYFKGVQVFKYKVGKYIYNYSNLQEEKDAGYCLRTCNEVVKVDYGPPIYSRGGMCFEYRIKVSSIVNCESDTSHIKVPECESEVCLPVPKCYGYGSDGSVSYVLHQGGPNEDFEACINECDGGKYTDKCSEKCYNKVYMNSSNSIENQIALTYADKVYATELADDTSTAIPNNAPHHYYRTEGGGRVKFRSEGHSASLVGRAWDTFGQTLGLWYAPSRANYYVINGHTYTYMVNTNGIVRQPSCGDDCHWEGCEANNSYLDFDCKEHTDAGVTIKYFNAETGKTDEVNVCSADELVDKDCEYNKKRYEAAVNACKAATTCANSEATYTIKFKYQEDGTKGSEKKIKEITVEDNTSHKNNVVRDNITTKTILSYGGCYANGDAKRWYQTEWTTPGTWQENKHQYASYTKPSNTTGWTYVEGQVCLSPYAHETNKKWANEYLKTYVSSGYTPDFSGKFNKKKYDENRINTETALEGYNIYGESNGFGYFGWKFSVSCFYAISNDETKCNTNPCCVGDECPDTTCENPPCDNNTTRYTTRSYDDKNPIVNSTESRIMLEDGSLLTNFENLPFNWSSAATMKYYAAGGYNNNPEDLLKLMMENAQKGETFSQEQIDYEYIMDSQVINFIRDYNNEHKNYEFASEDEAPKVSKDTGIQYYESKFLDELDGQSLKDGTPAKTVNTKDRASMRAKNYRAQGSLN